MLRILARFADGSRQALKRGASLADIRGLACLDPIVRMKNTIPGDAGDRFDALYRSMTAELDALQRRFA
jgi:hypothetical protein